MIRDNDFINGFDIERILGDLPIDIIKENIKSQIDDPLTFMTNHCDQVYETLDEAMDEIGHIDEYRYELEEIRDDFNSFLIMELDNGFGLGIDIENLQSYEMEELGRNSYEFFVVNLRENITNFLKNYICINKTSLAELFTDEYKRKDVTTTNMKKLTKNRDDVVIYEENGKVLENFYKSNGGCIKVICRSMAGHHPHGLDDPTPIINFIDVMSLGTVSTRGSVKSY